jgi:hypothetical protein
MRRLNARTFEDRDSISFTHKANDAIAQFARVADWAITSEQGPGGRP